MFKKSERRGMTVESQHEVVVYSNDPGSRLSGKTRVEHFVGKEEISIVPGIRGQSTIPVAGREDLALLRDALIDICSKLQIPR